jgi:hypothetical protein
MHYYRARCARPLRLHVALCSSLRSRRCTCKVRAWRRATPLSTPPSFPYVSSVARCARATSLTRTFSLSFLLPFPFPIQTFARPRVNVSQNAKFSARPRVNARARAYSTFRNMRLSVT